MPKTAAHLLEELRAHRTKVEAVILGELMFDGRAIHVGEFLAVKQFATERAALEYVDRFTYGRRLCGLEPLIVARSADGFSVLNPDYPTARFKLDTGGRVKRDG